MLFKRCFFPVLICLFFGCSVKEERGECPASLILKLPPAWDDSVVGLFVSFVMGPDGVADTQLAPLYGDSSVVSYRVSRERFILSVCSEKWADSVMVVETGKEYPPLYSYLASVLVKGDAASVTPVFRKDFCRIEISLVPQSDQYVLRFRGGYCGVNMRGEPVKGPLATDAKAGSAVRIPRQGDASLLLDVVGRDGSVLRTFAVGEYMDEAGYDWNLSYLEDISLQINYATSSLSLAGNGWSRIFPIKIEL